MGAELSARPSARSDGGDLLRGNGSSVASNAAKACDHIPVASDDIDVELSEHLQALRPDACAKLHLVRKAHGIYEIDGRQISLQRTDDGTIVVREDQVSLQTYLEQTAYVSERTSRDKNVNITFGDARIPDDTDPFTARLMCMAMACDQAEKRQAHQAQQARPVFQQRGSPAAPSALAQVAASTAAAAARANGFPSFARTTSTSAADVAEVPTSAMRDAQASTNENGQKQEQQNDFENEKEKELESPTRSWWQQLTGQGSTIEEVDSEESSEEEDERAEIESPEKSSRGQRPKECL